MKAFLKRAIVGSVALAILSTVLIATGMWDQTIVQPVNAMFGGAAAQKVDEAGRGAVADGQELAGKIKNGEFNVKDVLNDLGDIELPARFERQPKYEREQFGDGWQSNLDGCSTRELVLQRDLTKVTMRSDRKCKVATGILNPDPYTGKKITFDSVKDPMDVQIDHIVPLSKAWQMGAWKWDSNKRVAFANDMDELIASDGPENNRKSDKSPSQWLPKNEAFVCEYSARYVAVTKKYDLALPQADQDALREVLDQC